MPMPSARRDKENHALWCLLIRLRFNNTQLASIFAVSPASISQKKFRLKKHLLESGRVSFTEDMTLDRWLVEFS